MLLCKPFRCKQLLGASPFTPTRTPFMRKYSVDISNSKLFFEHILSGSATRDIPTKNEKEEETDVNSLKSLSNYNKFLLPEPSPSGWKEELFSIVVRAKRNNTFLNITNHKGDIIFTTTAKSSNPPTPGKKGIRNGTALAVASLKNKIDLCLNGEDKKSQEIKTKHDFSKLKYGYHVRLAGLGPGRVPAVQALANSGFDIVKFTEETSLKHAGCRPRRPKRF